MRKKLLSRNFCRRMLLTALSTCVMLLGATAQNRTVTGTVTDNGGNPLPGVTVLLKGTTTGVTTDGKGHYSIRAASAASVLVYSFVGYDSVEETVGSRNAIHVTLKDSSIAIEEVVSIGYGVKKKSDLTGSIGSVSAEELVAKGSFNVMDALQGQVPGVDIVASSGRAGGGFGIQIRGQNSLSGGDPLYVVDGIVVDDLSFVNPGDVERIDVLKDASSNAIYGSRGSNGVIIVTTKRGNEEKDKVSITYEGSYSFKQIARLPEFMNGEQFWDFRKAAYLAANTNSGTNISTFTMSANEARSAIASPLAFQRVTNGDYFDWVDAVFKNSNGQSHSVRVAGNSKTGTYIVGLGYQKDEGSFDGDDYERLNIRGGYDAKIKEIAKVGIQANLSYTNRNSGSVELVKNALQMNPILHPFDENGEWVLQPGTPAGLKIPSGWNSLTSKFNPLLDVQNTINNAHYYYVLANIYGELTPWKGLSIKTQLSPSYRQSRRGEYYGVMTDKRYEKGTNQATVRYSNHMDYTWDNTVAYSGKTGDHVYDAMFVFSALKETNEVFANTGEGLPTESFYSIDKAATLVPIASSQNTLPYQSEAILSLIGRVNYTYKSKYLLTASIRADGSSKFAPGRQWATFPSFALGWRIMEEDFLKNKVQWIDNLKLRFSYGNSGNNRMDPYSTNALASVKEWYTFGTENTLALGLSPDGIANKMITWERTREANIGLDFAFLRNRISGTFDFYDKISKGLIMDRKLPVETGIADAKVKDNVGSVNNRGIEVGLTTRNIVTKNVNWTTTFTYARNKNKIVELYGAKEDDPANRWFIGQPIKIAYQYVYEGVVSRELSQTQFAKDNALKEGQGYVRDITGPDGVPDGKLTSLDRVVTGCQFPKWTGNFSSSLRVYNFDFSFNIFANIGRYVKSSFYADCRDVGGRQKYKLNIDYYVPEIDPANISYLPTALINGVQPFPDNTKFSFTPNLDAELPRANNAGSWFNTDSDDFQNGWADVSFVKVRNIAIGYNFPSKLISKAKMSALRLYLNVSNPFVFTDYEGYDPEWATAKTTEGDGPSTIVWQMGVSVKF